MIAPVLVGNVRTVPPGSVNLVAAWIGCPRPWVNVSDRRGNFYAWDIVPPGRPGLRLVVTEAEVKAAAPAKMSEVLRVKCQQARALLEQQGTLPAFERADFTLALRVYGQHFPGRRPRAMRAALAVGSAYEVDGIPSIADNAVPPGEIWVEDGAAGHITKIGRGHTR